MFIHSDISFSMHMRLLKNTIWGFERYVCLLIKHSEHTINKQELKCKALSRVALLKMFGLKGFNYDSVFIISLVIFMRFWEGQTHFSGF